MILLVCGGRNFNDETAGFAALDRAHAKRPVTLLVHGDADGADKLSGRWATARGIHSAKVPALWNHFGRSAGPKRNEAMLILRPDGVVAFPGGSGTADMVRRAKAAGLVVWQPMGA